MARTAHDAHVSVEKNHTLSSIFSTLSRFFVYFSYRAIGTNAKTKRRLLTRLVHFMRELASPDSSTRAVGTEVDLKRTKAHLKHFL